MGVSAASAATQEGLGEWLRDKLRGEGGRNLRHVHTKTGCSVSLDEGGPGDASALRLLVRAPSYSALAHARELVNDLVQVISKEFERRVERRAAHRKGDKQRRVRPCIQLH